MFTEDNMLAINSNKNLHYITEHKRAFEIEYLYPLEIFETFADQTKNWGLECSCKINQSQLYPTRFNLFRKRPTFGNYHAAFNFLRSMEAQLNLKFDYQLLQQFIGNDLDFSKVIEIIVGVDLRSGLEDSKLKFCYVIQDYPEKLEIAADMAHAAQEWPILLGSKITTIGFDFHFNGRSEIEIYPIIGQDKLQQIDVQMKLAEFLSPQALRLLDNCRALDVGCSQANPEKILYYRTLDPHNFIAELHNELANRVHAYYREQPVIETIVGLRETEIIAGKIENLNLYYQMSISSN
ncbi:MAG TPA: LynF/TruF/PatF family peptide O-prenyltransferase [Trichormus sp. M33_DOE_039]|nr:LynF/TruF/PatF family peptide O-prenyltransferase [Trichormus sp. M33_DOE_039]